VQFLQYADNFEGYMQRPYIADPDSSKLTSLTSEERELHDRVADMMKMCDVNNDGVSSTVIS